MRIAVFYGDDQGAKEKLVSDVKSCCLHNGFFQITGHSVPRELQQRAFECSKRFFELPLEEKMRVGKGETFAKKSRVRACPDMLAIVHAGLICRAYPGLYFDIFSTLVCPRSLMIVADTNTWGRGYEPLKYQMLEAGTSPDLKEGYIVAEDLPKTHPSFLAKKLNSGPNMWPQSIENLEEFKSTCTDYYHAVVSLANDVLSILAMTLDLDPAFFKPVMEKTCSTVRFLHYPPQPPDADESYRGVGAHTDFGSITLLLQDDVDGLQVWEKATQTWLDVREK